MALSSRIEFGFRVIDVFPMESWHEKGCGMTACLRFSVCQEEKTLKFLDPAIGRNDFIMHAYPEPRESEVSTPGRSVLQNIFNMRAIIDVPRVRASIFIRGELKKCCTVAPLTMK